MNKVFDAHSHFEKNENYKTQHLIDNVEYKIEKRIVSIDPFIKKLICKKNEKHFMHFAESSKNSVVIKCMDCNEKAFDGVDPYIIFNETLLNTSNEDNQFVFIMPALVKSSVNESIKYLVDKFPQKVKGIKLYTGTTYTTLNEIGEIESVLPLLIHTGVFKNQEPKSMFNFLKNYKGKICLAHFARLDKECLDLVKNLDNVYVDTSPAYYMYERYIKNGHKGGFFEKSNISKAEDLYYEIIDKLGVDKLLWGSDFPFANISEELSVINNLNLSKDEKQKILYTNACEFVDI